jgi:hypothetical protein
MNNLDRSFCVGSLTEVMASEAENGNLRVSPAEFSQRDGSAGGLWHGFIQS